MGGRPVLIISKDSSFLFQEAIESETSKGSDVFKKQFETVTEKLKQVTGDQLSLR